MICAENGGRVVQNRRGASTIEIRRARMVQRAMAPERKAHGPQSQNYMFVSHAVDDRETMVHIPTTAMLFLLDLSHGMRLCRRRSRRCPVLPQTRGSEIGRRATNRSHASQDQDALVGDIVCCFVLCPIWNIGSRVLSCVVDLSRRCCWLGLAQRRPLARMGATR